MRIFSLCLLVHLVHNLNGQSQLPIPDTLSGEKIQLNIHKDSVDFFLGKKSKTYAFNNFRYLGPTLILRNGVDTKIEVFNQIGDTTTVHWHGLHVPALWDGGPHTVIPPDSVWRPRFRIKNSAATYWYHPHLHMKTAEQAIKGAAGLIIVKDSIEEKLNLPRNYGVDDIPLIVQSQQYDSMNQAMPRGMQDSSILVNGIYAGKGHDIISNIPAQIVRLRILNASGERVFNFGFSLNKKFYVIAGDGGLLDTPVLTERIRLAPGERAELLLNLNGLEGQTFQILSYGSELPMGVQGGPTMPMPGGPPMDSPLNGVDFGIMDFKVISKTALPVEVVPKTLAPVERFNLQMITNRRTIRFTADSQTVMDGPFYFNDSSYNMQRIDFRIPLGSIEVWKLENQTMVAHPFHIHDVQFLLLNRNGQSPSPVESGKKDVVLVPPGDSVTFITRFEDYTDTVIPYMYHCHILMHEDDGMMGQFVVCPKTTGVNSIGMNQSPPLIYPNPAVDYVEIQLNGKGLNATYQAEIFNFIGQKVFIEKDFTGSLKIDTHDWDPGVYWLRLETSDLSLIYKIVIESR